MEIVFVSDYVCPYCLVAKEAMRQALKELGLHPEIVWHPFELTREPKPQVDTWHDEERKAHYQVLVEPCRQLGLDMKLPPHVVPRPYTRLAFEGYLYAKEHGCGEAYNDLVYHAYFIEEKDIGNRDILCQIARQTGLDVTDYQNALEAGIYREAQMESNQYAREKLQVTHVPTIYVDGKEVSLHEYTKEEFLDILRTELEAGVPAVAKEEKEDSQNALPIEETGSCGLDGCRF